MASSSPRSLVSNFQQCLNSYKLNKTANEKKKMLSALKNMCDNKLKVKITIKKPVQIIERIAPPPPPPLKKEEEKAKDYPICPHDKTEIQEGQNRWECSACHTLYHEACICDKLEKISGTLDPQKVRFWPCSCLNQVILKEKDIELLFGGRAKLEQIRNKKNDELIKNLMISFTKYEKFTCEIDGNEHYIDQDCITLDCDHKFCKECIKENLEFELERGNFKVVCPGDDCDTQISFDIMQYVLGNENQGLFERYLLFKIEELSLNPGDSLGKCPNSNCNFKIIYPTNINNIFYDCPNCQKKFCLNGCHQVHEGQTCKEFELSNKEKEAIKEFNKLKAQNKLKHCPKCNLLIEKRKGCNHITCPPPCSFQFCYVCGEAWRNGICGHQFNNNF